MHIYQWQTFDFQTSGVEFTYSNISNGPKFVVRLAALICSVISVRTAVQTALSVPGCVQCGLQGSKNRPAPFPGRIS